MLIVGVFYQNNAHKAGMPRAYLARLKPGLRGSIEREFAKPQQEKTNLRQVFMRAEPGQVFEACRWRWDGAAYVGGKVWFGVQRAGRVTELTRDEAFAAVLSGPLAGQPPEPGSMVPRGARRMDPPDVFVVEKPD